MFSTGWGQNNSYNMNALDTSEPLSIPFDGGNANQELAGKSIIRSSQEIGHNPSEDAKSRNNDARSVNSSSNNPNQDLYRFFNDRQK